MRDTRTILLAMLSVGLVATWVYHLYDKTQYSKTQPTTRTNPDTISISKLQDSLQQVYSSTVNDLGAQLDSVKNTAGFLQGELIARLDEINRLKSEIADLLKNNNTNQADLDLAGKKTARFQQLVAGLPKKNTPSVVESNQPLTVVNENPSATTRIETEVPDNSIPPVFTASDLRFTPIKITDDKEEETTEAEAISKLVISFAVRNSLADFNNAEVYAIITQPDGRVLQTDQWESASISTHDYGKKTYTRKMRFEYQKGEIKQLQLTLKPEDYEKGNYRLQVFHNGYLIGETIKRLN